MSDKEELHSRVGQFEQAISAFDSKQKALLRRLQEGLGLARQKLVERKLEVERLKHENLELRQIIDRLLESVEGQSKDAMGEQLGALDRELASLMALAEDETQPVAVGEVTTPSGSQAESTTAQPDGAVAAETEDDDELASTFSDIQQRIQDLAEQFPKSEPAGEEANTAKPEAIEVAPPASASEPESPRRAETPSRRAPSRSEVGPAAAPAKAYPKVRGPLDAEVGYALSVLRQMRRSDKLFSIEDVRELINGKFGLDLSAQQDAQIRACLLRRDGVYPNPKNDSFWRFGDAA